MKAATAVIIEGIRRRRSCINCERKRLGINGGYHCGKCWCCKRGGK